MCCAVRELENGHFWSEVIGIEEVTVYERNDENAQQGIRGRLEKILEEFEPFEIGSLVASNSVQVGTLSMEIQPASRNRIWQDPQSIRLYYLWWALPSGGLGARVSEFNLQLFAQDIEQLEDRIRRHVLISLRSIIENNQLAALRAFHRVRNVAVSTIQVKYQSRTPLEIEKDPTSEGARSESILTKVATDLHQEQMSPIWCVDESLNLLRENFTSSGMESILLVGDSGVGKTALFRELCRLRDSLGLADWKFWMTTGARLVSGQSGFGMWQEQCIKLVREVAGKKILFHVGNLLELIQSGRSSHNKRGIGSFLKESLQRGNLIVVAECTPEQLHIIEQEDPQILSVFKVQKVRQPSRIQIQEILKNFSAHYRPQIQISSGAIERVGELHQQFATYSVAPGRPLRFLRNLLDDRTPLPSHSPARNAAPPAGSHPDHESPTGTLSDPLDEDEDEDEGQEGPAIEIELTHAMESGLSPDEVDTSQSKEPPLEPRLSTEDVTKGFSEETGLPFWMLEASEPLDLHKAREWFTSKVIGQALPVEKVIDLLALTKAGLNRRHKPIGSLLFIGPTGVGKTELAKALARFLFGDENRMIRFDMGEFSDPMAHIRLIFSQGQEEGLLTARIREQPFSVVLLDEFEKASARVFDLLLQVLGEGRLTDAVGRVADFSNTVIIMTSNLGVKNYQTGSLGFGASGRVDPVEHFTTEVKKFLRPEMFNRLDSVVAFGPLDRDSVRRITRLHLENLKWRDGLRGRGVDLYLDEGIVDQIVEAGFDPRYGARPLKRAIESMILRPLAARLTSQSTDVALKASVRLIPKDARKGATTMFDFEIRTQQDESGRPIPSTRTRQSAISVAGRVSELRRSVRGIFNKAPTLTLQSRLNRLRMLVERHHHLPSQPADVTQAQHSIHKIEQCFHQVTLAIKAIETLERCTLKSIYTMGELDDVRLLTQLSELESTFHSLQKDIFRINFQGNPDRVVMVLYGPDRAGIRHLFQAYLTFLRHRGWRLDLYLIESRDGQHYLMPHQPEDPDVDAAIENPRSGLVLEVTGEDSWFFLSLEKGMHRSSRSKSDPASYVEVSCSAIPQPVSGEGKPVPLPSSDKKSFPDSGSESLLHVPEGFGDRQFRYNGPEVRRIFFSEFKVQDSLMGRRGYIGSVEVEIARLMTERLDKEIENQFKL